jgi:hypothetical protein
MSGTLTVTHKAFGAEVRRGTYDVVLDGDRVGSVDMNDTFEIPVEPGRHNLQVRSGRNSSRTVTFDTVDDGRVAFRSSSPAWHSRSTASSRRLRTALRRGHDASPPAATRPRARSAAG